MRFKWNFPHHAFAHVVVRRGAHRQPVEQELSACIFGVFA
jgi:hypothetical protein